MKIVIAQAEELKLVKELGLDNYPVIITGVGALNVMRALKGIPKEETILNIGYCGSNNIPIGSKVQVLSVNTMHEGVDFTEPAILCDRVNTEYVLAPCYTCTHFVEKTNIKEDCVFDMELVFIASMFDYVKSIKVVSDNLSLKQYKENVC